MRNIVIVLVTIVMALGLSSCEEKIKVDMIVHNAVIYTVDASFSKATGLAVKDGRLIEVGDQQKILDAYESKNIIDAKGKPLYPGFNDGHSHFHGYGLSVTESARLVGTKSFDEVVDLVVEHAQKYPSEWVLGRGWDQNDWEVKEFPTKEKLDAAFPDRPVVLRRVDGHAIIANSEAMRRAGITPKSSVAGGQIILIDGEPSGIFIDKAISLVGRVIPGPSMEQSIAALLTAQKDCFAVGLTTVTDAGVGKNTVLLMEDMQNSGDLKMRIYAMLSPSEENFKHFFPNGPLKTERLNVGSVKLYIDGALGSRGALLLQPYSDSPNQYGLQLNEQTYYDDICQSAFDAGFQVNTHAIGDSGNRIMLRTYAKYLKGSNDKRWRVEHAQVLHPADFSLFGEYDIIPSIQTTHCTSDMYWADERLGEERVKHAYAYKELLKENGWLINGTDFPVEGISPLKTFYAAVGRMDDEGWPAGGFQMENALSREEALRSITIWPAMGSFEEAFKGSLEKGKAADFVILKQDIMTIETEKLTDVLVEATFLGGEKVYQAN